VSIIDKHPAPWKETNGGITDARKHTVGAVFNVQGNLELKRLILAAPEMLAALKACVEHLVSEDRKGANVVSNAESLIARIEGE
jgi:hypothetical protein